MIISELMHMIMKSEIFQFLVIIVIIRAIIYAILMYSDNPKENGSKALKVFLLTLVAGVIFAFAFTGFIAAILGYAFILFIFIALLLIL